MKKTLLPIILSAILCGCATTSTTIKTEGVTITTVDTGMKIWASYVNTHLTDGKVTQKEINDVEVAYTAYYNSQLVLEAALEMQVTNKTTADNSIVSNTVNTTETSLLALINRYLNQ